MDRDKAEVSDLDPIESFALAMKGRTVVGCEIHEGDGFYIRFDDGEALVVTGSFVMAMVKVSGGEAMLQ